MSSLRVRNTVLGVGLAIGGVFATLQFIVLAVALTLLDPPYVKNTALGMVAVAIEVGAYLLAASSLLRRGRVHLSRLRTAAFALAGSYLWTAIVSIVLRPEVSNQGSTRVSIPIWYFPLALAAVFAAAAIGRSGRRRHGPLAWAGLSFSAAWALVLADGVHDCGLNIGWAWLASVGALIVAGLIVAGNAVMTGRQDGGIDHGGFARRELSLCFAGGAYMAYGVAIGHFSSWYFGSSGFGWRQQFLDVGYQLLRLSRPLVGFCVFLAFLISWNAVRSRSDRDSLPR